MSAPVSNIKDAVKTELSLVQSTPKRHELVIGPLKVKVLGRDGQPTFESPVFVDTDASLAGFRDSLFDEIHAYHVLQRMGGAGDAKSFFAMFTELWRVLKPGGHIFATVPSCMSDWLWGDPGNVRAITCATITFLQQPEYDKQVGVTAMSDYRPIYKADFEPELLQDDSRELRIVLRAIKPPRGMT